MTFPWADRHYEQMRVLAADGYSASEIRMKLLDQMPYGTELSRSAVIGKMSRQKIPFRYSKTEGKVMSSKKPQDVKIS